MNMCNRNYAFVPVPSRFRYSQRALSMLPLKKLTWDSMSANFTLATGSAGAGC